MSASDPLSLIFSALGDPTRRAILSRLSEGPVTVRELAKPFEISAPAVSQHLKVLERAQLIERTVEAQWRRIKARPQALDPASEWVERHRRDWSERLDALEDYLQTSEGETE